VAAATRFELAPRVIIASVFIDFLRNRVELLQNEHENIFVDTDEFASHAA
jgi:hypothetical protein